MFLKLYSIWLGAYSIAFTFLPLTMVFEWRKRGTADGFSSVMFVIPTLIQSCWLRHGLLTNNQTNIIVNAANILIFSCYIITFAYYQPVRKYLYAQLSAAAIVIFVINTYVNSFGENEMADKMGSIAAGTQMLSLFGGLYEIKRAISLRTTEYVPAPFQFAIFTFIGQWLIFALLTGNYFMAIANIAGLTVNIATISMYFIYPPQTWTVPILNIKPVAKKED